MSKTYTVSIAFDFEPEGEHAEMFEGMSPTNIERMMKDLVVEDIFRLANNNDLYKSLTIEEKE